jgi:arginine deiminase
MMDQLDFVIDPLPNLLFTRDSSVWVRDRVAVTSLAMPARRRETTLTHAIYRYHPRFAGTELLYEPRWSMRGWGRAAARARSAGGRCR